MIREGEITKEKKGKQGNIDSQRIYIYMYIKGRKLTSTYLLPMRIRWRNKARRYRQWKRVDSIVAKAISKRNRRQVGDPHVHHRHRQSRLDVKFVTASGVYVQFGQKRKRNISNRTPSPVVHTLLTCLQRTLMTPGPGVDFELYYTRHCWLV